jgi:hypothetical protein
MNNSRGMIGFDRKIHLAWLDATADWAAQGLSAQEIRRKLDQLLEGEVAGTGTHSAKGKTETVLLRIWVLVPDQIKPLRDEALVRLLEQSEPNRLLFHWGLSLAAYPFFKVVVETAGRLLTLQGSFTGAQAQRRVREIFGERETVTRAAQRVLRSLADWGVIRESGEPGVYLSTAPRAVHD